MSDVVDFGEAARGMLKEMEYIPGQLVGVWGERRHVAWVGIVTSVEVLEAGIGVGKGVIYHVTRVNTSDAPQSIAVASAGGGGGAGNVGGSVASVGGTVSGVTGGAGGVYANYVVMTSSSSTGTYSAESLTPLDQYGQVPVDCERLRRAPGVPGWGRECWVAAE